MSATLDANKKWDWKAAQGDSVPLLRQKQCCENFRENTASGEAVAHRGEKCELEDFSQPGGVAVADAVATPPPSSAAPATEEWTWKPVKGGTHQRHRFGPEEADDYPWQPMRTNGGRQSAGGFSRPLPEVFHRELYECAFCGGTGEKSEGSRCPVCHSKGLVKIKPPVVKCPFCHDRGEVPRNSGVTCPVCKGKGWVSIKEPIDICRSCNGRGRKTGEGLYCSPCRGTGVVHVKSVRASTPQVSQGRVMSLEVGSRPHKVSVQPSEREVLEILQDEGGVMGKSQLARFMGVTSTYSESLCRKLTDKGCLEEVDIKTFALTPVGEAIGRAALAKTKAKEQKENARQDKRKKKVQAVRNAAQAEMQAMAAGEQCNDK